MNPYGDDEYEDEQDYQNNPEYFCPNCRLHEDYCQCQPEDFAGGYWDDEPDIHTEVIDLGELGLGYATDYTDLDLF